MISDNEYGIYEKVIAFRDDNTGLEYSSVLLGVANCPAVFLSCLLLWICYETIIGDNRHRS